MEPRTSPEVGGMGHSVKRKEDPRFIRGQGNYVDDVVLPDMLYLDIVRSPYAHAKIKNIDTSKALAIPGVLAVITGKDLEKYNLHWMPTLMSDTQMVLPVEKVMYQAQEVAAVLATTRYIAADGVDAVEVDYDPLEVVVDPKKALLPDAPVLYDAASLEGGLLVDGFVNDGRTIEEWLNSLRPLYESGALLDATAPCHPRDASTWFFDAVRQIRLHARQFERHPGQYATALAVALLKKSCNSREFADRRQMLRAGAFVIGEMILTAETSPRK